MADVHSPTVRRHELGRQLRMFRTGAGLTVEQAAEQLHCSPSKISRMETGQRGARADDIQTLCEIYGIQDIGRRQQLIDLAREGRHPGWWTSFDLPYATYVGFEAAAVAISAFAPGVFPGLLQTPDYARALHEQTLPPLDQEVIDRRIEERRTRQKILVRENAPHLRAVVDEAVLHRAVGGPRVMAEQLAHIVDSVKMKNITVQILPYSAGAHPALGSSFVLLDFASPLESLVHIEDLAGQDYKLRPQDIQLYKQIYERLTAIAMSPRESADFMTSFQLMSR